MHSYPIRKRSCGLSCFLKPQRRQKDFRFLASSSEEALQWVGSFADLQCFVNCLRHPLGSSKKQGSETVPSDFSPEHYIKCKSPPRILVILNPRSGHGRSTKVFHGKVEPIFKVCFICYDFGFNCPQFSIVYHACIYSSNCIFFPATYCLYTKRIMHLLVLLTVQSSLATSIEISATFRLTYSIQPKAFFFYPFKRV